MTTSAPALEFFIVEASSYIDGLDTLIASAGSGGPDREALVRLARSLRGNSMMYRQPGISRVASALERAARALRDGSLAWGPGPSATFVGAVDDLRILVRAVRTWGTAEDERARARAAELDSMAPPTAGRRVVTPTPTGDAQYLAERAAALAEALERMAASAADDSALGALLREARTMSGAAVLKEQPSLAEVVDAVERAALAVEVSGGTPSPDQIRHFRSAAGVLARAAAELRAGRPLDAALPELRELARAAGTVAPVGGAPVVPIAQLFFDDAGPHVLSEASAPPTRAADRFRIEVVGQAEHLRRLVADARAAHDPAGRERATRELRDALRTLVGTAESFGEGEVADALGAWRRAAEGLDAGALGAVDGAAALLTDPSSARDTLLQRLAALAAAAAPADTPAPARGGAARVPAARGAQSTPTGEQLRALLQDGITEISRLDDRPLSEPRNTPHDVVVPIDQLVYRGRAALRRAAEIRDDIRSRGTAAPEMLDELFALLDLALAD